MPSVDDRLASFADDILWLERRPVTRMTGRRLPFPRGGGSAQAVREHVHHLVRATPQVVVKITGSASDMRRLRAHLQYIQRGERYRRKEQEEFPLETEEGDLLRGREGREVAEREFAQGGHPIPEEALPAGVSSRARRETLHIVLSMPASSGRDPVKQAARATCARLFEGHQWLMVHHEDTDNQHAHLVVKSVGKNGQRLNPRKADLEQWRQAFAQELRLRGVAAVATRRRVRMRRYRGESQAVREMKARGIRPAREATSMTQPMARERAIANEARMRRAYAGIAEALAASSDIEDRRLARELTSHLGLKPKITLRPGM